VARPELHPTEGILDAARALVLEDGVGAATVAEIARTSGAPTGSIYHRFASVDELLAQLWVRAIRRSQAEFAAAADLPDPLEAGVAGALSVYDFCARHPADARLLLSFRRTDLVRKPISAAMARELEELNAPIGTFTTDLARRLYGSADAEHRAVVSLAVFDLPQGAVRRPLIDGKPLGDARRRALERAVRAALGSP
jgi:AcrR family transcriptional regulator